MDGPRVAAREQPLEHRILLTATLCLLAAGAVMVYSASSARTLLEGQGDGTSYLVKYLIYGALGFVVMQVVARMDLQRIRDFTPALLGVSFVLVVAGQGPRLRRPGQRRAALARRRPAAVPALGADEDRADPLRGAAADRQAGDGAHRQGGSPARCCTCAGAAVLLIASQPDLGTALVICFSLTALLVAAGMPIRFLVRGALILAAIVLLFAIVEPYRRDRLASFLDPWAHAQSIGFQSVQGQIALGSGGLLGRGLGESVQKIFFLPEAHTDFILAVIGEELGVHRRRGRCCSCTAWSPTAGCARPRRRARPTRSCWPAG